MTDSHHQADALLSKADRRGARRKMLVRVLVAASLLAVACAVPAARNGLTAEYITALIERMGVMGPLGLVFVGLVGPIFFVPRMPVCIVAGLLYGLTMGSIVGLVAGTAGSIVHYYLSMGLLSRSASRLTPQRWLRPLSAIRTHPFRALLLLRLFPLSNASVVNMVAGLLRVPFIPYVGATVMGTLPITVIYALWGQTARQPSGAHVALSIVLLVSLTLLAWLLPRARGFFQR
ncbi:MAG: TVP38/TMEM64 family protein [Verrucomicrobia bacterium]|jgi:uncharacterized membrane protein YdjX (TVP38/TMEM64 family)|nr:TVP38/TMEM64 family protein [Verrucomicrobiota bacterium]MBT7066760.1 TVP38/TMEM64 family protein [Verrucomicrobiota bacterium]MBT7700936.1 TVP38/TMEM64 family protein [Verrucomicrobiota bacterium]